MSPYRSSAGGAPKMQDRKMQDLEYKCEGPRTFGIRNRQKFVARRRISEHQANRLSMLNPFTADPLKALHFDMILVYPLFLIFDICTL